MIPADSRCTNTIYKLFINKIPYSNIQRASKFQAVGISTTTQRADAPEHSWPHPRALPYQVVHILCFEW